MYIPLSNITEVNYTSGLTFAIELTQQQYVGYYHKDKNNDYWSGQTHDNNSVKLVKITDNNIEFDYVKAGYNKLKPKVLPNTAIQPDFIFPTSQDYTNGFFTRYIVKPTISTQLNDFIEITNAKYLNITQSPDLLVLYKPTSFLWKLTGPLYDIYKDNIRVYSGIIDTNKRSISEAEKFLPNLSLYFTDLKQFGKPS